MCSSSPIKYVEDSNDLSDKQDIPSSSSRLKALLPSVCASNEEEEAHLPEIRSEVARDIADFLFTVQHTAHFTHTKW